MTIDECHDCGKAYERWFYCSPYGKVKACRCEECDEIHADRQEPSYDYPSAEQLRLEAMDIQRRLK